MEPDVDARDTTLAEWAENGDLSGIVLADRDGETLHLSCHGYSNRADGVPVTPRTRFGLASLTKMFTATTVVGLASGGSLDLHAPVADLLSAEHRPATLRPDVTVHHLLCHTSGIADYAEEDEDSPRYVEDYADLWRTRPVHRMEQPADFLPLFGDLPAYRGPGLRTQYSNAGYVVLALVVEEVTGQAFTDAVTQRVLAPLGMLDSGFFRLDEVRPDLAVGYLPPPAPGEPWRTNIYSMPVIGGGDGGMFATAADLVTFTRAYAAGAILGTDVRDLMLTRHAEDADGFAFGYGVLLYPDGRWGHGGGDPGVEVLLNHWPQTRTTVVVLTNVAGPTGEVRDAVARAVGAVT